MDAILKQELIELQKQAWDQLAVTASYGGHTKTLNIVALKLEKCIVDAEARTKEKAAISEPNPHFGRIGVLEGAVKSFRAIPFPRRLSYEIPPFGPDSVAKDSLTDPVLSDEEIFELAGKCDSSFDHINSGTYRPVLCGDEVLNFARAIEAALKGEA